MKFVINLPQNLPIKIVNMLILSYFFNINKQNYQQGMSERFKQLAMLKQKATTHMNEKKYSWAMVYLCDTLKEFQSVIDQIDSAEEMEKLIRQVKVPSHKNLSLCYLKQGNYIGCIEQCKQVLEIEPNSVKILFRLGISHMNTNNLIQAQRFLRQAFLLEPNQKQVMKALERLEYLNNAKDKTEGKKNIEGGFSIGLLIKIIFLWPFLIMLWLYRKVVPNKSKSA